MQKGVIPLELFRLLGTIAINNSEAKKTLEETAEQGEKTQSKLATAFDKMGSAAVKMGKVVATGMAAGGAAIVAIAKQAVGSYAEYEQLVGGVETLFKESADTVMQYAQDAYKTAGLSANEYMETVTSFSASLLQSLGKDTVKAAEYADMAITDMADNANKMGTNIGMIQNAYQGFAKQNYTMLDNLKLGYGGTQEEMFRLMSDAKKIDKTFDAVFSLDAKGHLEAGFADIVEAIHIVQTEMGITGTTAAEASETIQGSVAAMKSAWQNLLTGMADENQNLDELFGYFLDSVVTVGNNVIPRIQNLLPRLVSAVSQMAQQLAANLPAIIETLLPSVLQGAINIVAELVKNIPALVQSVMTALSTSLQASYATEIQPVFEMLGQIITEILLPALQLVMDLIGKMVTFAQEHLGFLQEVFQAAIDIIAGIIQAFTAATEGDWKKFWQSIVKIVKGIGSALYEAGKGIFNMLWDGIKSIWTSIETWVSDKFSWITDKLNAVKSVLASIKAAVAEAAATSAEERASGGVSGNVQAHAAGGILTKPTIFGYTPSTNTWHLGGEAGAEAIAPIDVLQGYVRSAVADVSKSAETNSLLSKLVELQEVMLIAMENQKIEIDGREFGRVVKSYA